ncbi:SH3 domain-containing protein [Ancylobacter sp. A5.8]|uniref:SH3 domain-containing protein n=1 Tax=Ancylobacter gelatini TaxID=2919920 RepID=UPI001F4DCFED|nr:SH3 domain-containing protein [Ancylobacter gelatini]MCJ8142901.1 SH3 domain-containing protein [Ancylobacter gelatini]
MRFPRSLLLVAGFLLAGSLAASARPAVVTTDLNVRAGPGTGYRVIGSLPAGSSVDVGSCTGSWCRVAGGFASARFLAFGAGTRVVVQPAPVYYDDYYDNDLALGVGAFALGVGVGNAWGPGYWGPGWGGPGWRGNYWGPPPRGWRGPGWRGPRGGWNRPGWNGPRRVWNNNPGWRGRPAWNGNRGPGWRGPRMGPGPRMVGGPRMGGRPPMMRGGYGGGMRMRPVGMGGGRGWRAR